MNDGSLDARLKSACATRIAQDGKLDVDKEFQKVIEGIGLKEEDAGGKITFHGTDPIVNSTIALGTGSAIGLMAKSLAATKVWRMRGGEGQDMSIDISKGIARLSALYKMKETINGYNPDVPDRNLGALMMLCRTKDGRYVCPDNNMPKLRDRMQKLIGCTNNMDDVVKKILMCDSSWLESECVKEGLVMGKVRTLQEFMQEPVYQNYMKNVPLVEIEKIGDSDPEPLSMNPASPLSGVRALGLGHIIAGACIGRALACHGADVLNVWKPNEYEFDSTYYSADVGMRSCRIDYKSADGLEQLKNLMKDADIFFGNRRWKLLEQNGLTAEECAKIRPGIIFCNTSFAGDRGPWKDRVGYDQVAGCVTGLATFDGTPDRPQLPVINVVNDSLVGWLAAAGIMEALCRRATEGGSYRVHVSLCRVSLWLMSMGIFDKDYVARVYGQGDHEEKEADLFTAHTPLGFYQGYTDQVHMSRLTEDYDPVLVPRGSSAPVWKVDGKEPFWEPEDPSAHIATLGIQEEQENEIYAAYDKLPKQLFQVLKVLPVKKV